MTIKVPIPSYNGKDAAAARSINALKVAVEQLTGVRGDPVQPLAATATTAQIIAKINELVVRINVT